MIPTSRPILLPVTTPPVGELPAVPRHSQPHSLLTAQTQSTASTLNSRCRRRSRHQPAGARSASNLPPLFSDWLWPTWRTDHKPTKPCTTSRLVRSKP